MTTIAFEVRGLPAPQGNWVIYTLAAADGCVRYVGMTKQNIRKRLHAHVRRSKTEDTHKDRWLRAITESAGRLVCTIIETGVGDRWKAAEKDWIARLRGEGCALTNTTSGGEGCEGYRHSDAVKIAQSSRRRGRALSPAHKSAISATLTGRSLSMETREKMRGRRISEATRVRMSAAQKGHPVTAQTLAKMSAARKGKPLSARARANRPKTLSAAHRAAISAALKRSARYAK